MTESPESDLGGPANIPDRPCPGISRCRTIKNLTADFRRYRTAGYAHTAPDHSFSPVSSRLAADILIRALKCTQDWPSILAALISHPIGLASARDSGINISRPVGPAMPCREFRAAR